ncbi:MarR family winged helix-turn-helix transcriptional regulator [Glycomyces algeriensis]|jgi:DNA-binding MarR family transcriptional regulator|uniref:MarR family transcriptional regulator n=1 Tax=Glycomyces algeriensis TaxID=256037 RepID=A0A9W6GAI4_9ACTN|nr:MarR family transcriptional regulator [Glycomyces algeriensis]MDA1364615.1 MarR family transcriptional regulator [Glycomyces algeriensis]MDR7350652.1 DNA-binding MarR family transcriptional regulator [Glycomyces algeriensis]GLI43361.1 MarR family transcriptional regulator [Glycomyces algeriensis]
MNDETQWLSPREQHSWRAFIRLNQKLTARLGSELQTQSKLSGPDFAILVALTDDSAGRLRFQELAKAIDFEQSRLSHQIARMIKRGLVAREECAEDGRGAFVTITDQGRETIEAAAPKHVAAVRRLVLDAIPPEDLDALGDIAARIIRHLDETAP